MKITVRIPTEQYAYVEAQYDTIEEYEAMHPVFAATMTKVRETSRKAAIEAHQKTLTNEPPF